MQSINAVRRIDELGRIVIPKGIRNKLRINEGDRLEIGVNQDGKIEIQKYNAFGHNFSSINNIVHTLEKEIKKPILIISDYKILSRSKEVPYELLEGEDIEESIYNKAFSYKMLSINNCSLVKLGRKYDFVLIPIVNEGEVLGSIIIFDTQINEQDMRIVQAFRNLITTILKVWYT